MILHKAKKRIIILFLAFLITPFLLLTNFYPFMRFSMFAEPVRAQTTPTTYLLKTNSKINTTLISQDLLHQKVQEHKSANKLHELAVKISTLHSKRSIIELVEINELTKDTTVLVRYEK